MIDPRILSIAFNSRAGHAISGAIGRQNAAKKAEKPKPTQQPLKGQK